MYSERVQHFLDKKRINVGDEVRLIKDKKTYEGILMPRIELGDKDCLVLKLRNGYNIGIKFERNVKIEKLKGHKKLEKFPARRFEQKPNLPKVSLLATGGTIASRIDYLTGGVKMAFKPEEFFFTVPELADIITFKKIRLLSSLASEDLWYKNWQQMAEEAAKELNRGARGIIITHGTDTMHFSSAALSFMMKNLNKPIVFAGAQRSSDRGSSDTVMNLICSAHVAGYSDFAEVGICMHAESSDTFCFFTRGTKVRKCHTSRRDAFRPINDLPLAKVWPDGKIEIMNENYKKVSEGRIKADIKFEPKVALLKAYPGSDPKLIDHLVKDGIKGIVIEGTGLGHVPTSTPEPERSWVPHVKNAIDSNVPVVITSQCIWGRVHPYVYRNLRILDSTGVIWGEDMIPEVAYVKLGWVIAHTKNLKKIKEMMLTNYAGEISKRSDPRTFLY
ncbi:MAG: Glu-tRNA(Gln) amidotransferase subunit GatD [Candidatus Aenigmarchaeota archaeon]|nr:Glu-tRNA(Gln) amidotransferase subunit GatD [Candidatus Aenigmarchaeota archaeon]